MEIKTTPSVNGTEYKNHENFQKFESAIINDLIQNIQTETVSLDPVPQGEIIVIKNNNLSPNKALVFTFYVKEEIEKEKIKRINNLLSGSGEMSTVTKINL